MSVTLRWTVDVLCKHSHILTGTRCLSPRQRVTWVDDLRWRLTLLLSGPGDSISRCSGDAPPLFRSSDELWAGVERRNQNYPCGSHEIVLFDFSAQFVRVVIWLLVKGGWGGGLGSWTLLEAIRAALLKLSAGQRKGGVHVAAGHYAVRDLGHHDRFNRQNSFEIKNILNMKYSPLYANWHGPPSG